MILASVDFPPPFGPVTTIILLSGIVRLTSLIISFATGLLVTGTKSDEELGEQIKGDFTRDGYTYVIVGLITHRFM